MRSTARTAASLEHDGWVVLERAAPLAALRASRESTLEDLEACFRRARSLGLEAIPVGERGGYAEIVHRSPGRFELRPAIERRSLADGAAWTAAVRGAIGASARCVDRRISVTEPGAESGGWETAATLPSLGVFLPLGCEAVVEIRPRSHRLDGHVSSVVPRVPLGAALLLDGRVLRRWCENPSDEHRPILCVTYAPPGFSAVAAFPSRSLFGELPESRASVQKG